MSEKIVVPEGMLRAADNAWIEAGYDTLSMSRLRLFLEAALLWWSKNPIVPTDEQCDELIEIIGATGTASVRYPSRINRDQAKMLLSEWQRRMFSTTKLEIHPILKEWLDDCEAKGVDDAMRVNYIRLFERAFEAGKKA